MPPPPSSPPPAAPPQQSGKILGMSKGVAIAVGLLALVLVYIVIKRHNSQPPTTSPDSGQTAASVGGTPPDNSLPNQSDQTNDAALIDSLNQQTQSLAELEANLSTLTASGVGGNRFTGGGVVGQPGGVPGPTQGGVTAASGHGTQAGGGQAS